VIIPFCEEIACEERIKEMTKVEEREEGPDGQKLPSMGMKSLCIPFEQVRCLDQPLSATFANSRIAGGSYRRHNKVLEP
jgi:prolyl-tRNA synthetase